MFNQEDIGIFGDTQQGVPNPRVGHVHPYPTRYHGPIWTQPQAGYPYRPASYVQAPFVGYGQDVAQVAINEVVLRGLIVIGVGALLLWGASRVMKKQRSR